MKILVIDASKHDSTHGIAQAIGTELATRDLEVVVAPVQDVRTIDGYDDSLTARRVVRARAGAKVPFFLRRRRHQAAERVRDESPGIACPSARSATVERRCILVTERTSSRERRQTVRRKRADGRMVIIRTAS